VSDSFSGGYRRFGKMDKTDLFFLFSGKDGREKGKAGAWNGLAVKR